MEYVVDHEIIKLWDTYKPMIYLKDGPHTSPLMGLNTAILRLYCRFKTDVKIIIQSRDIAGSFCYSLAKSNVFAPLTPLRGVQR